MIERFYTITAAVTRLTYTSNKGTYSSVGSILGHLQQATAFAVAETASMYTLSHIFWTAVNANVNVNDNLTISGTKYSVKGIWLNNYRTNQHKELHLEKL